MRLVNPRYQLIDHFQGLPTAKLPDEEHNRSTTVQVLVGAKNTPGISGAGT